MLFIPHIAIRRYVCYAQMQVRAARHHHHRSSRDHFSGTRRMPPARFILLCRYARF